VFAAYSSRDIVLSFRGSIGKLGVGMYKTLDNLVIYRKRNVRELYAKRSAVNRTAFFREVFWAPGVLGLNDPEGPDDAASATPSSSRNTTLTFSRVNHRADPFPSTINTLLTYLRSQFCFQPPGMRPAQIKGR
jgi:hypothetical protein